MSSSSDDVLWYLDERNNTAKPPLKPGDVVCRYNVASAKANGLELDYYHVRRRPWESGDVHAPLIVHKSWKGEILGLTKTLWQSNADIADKIVRPGPFSFFLHWPDENDDDAQLGRASGLPVFPLFYTNEGYVYVPKRVLDRSDSRVEVKYVEFWGWNQQLTRSPPRELLYKANVKTGLHAREFPKNNAPADPMRDLNTDGSYSLQEEVKILELLNRTGSSHFAKLVGFPERTDGGFFIECDDWTRKGDDRLRRLLRGSGRFSTYSLWRLFQCLAKACAVMAWGSEYPDFPVARWTQIVHPDLGQPHIMISLTPDHGHTCGGSMCLKIADLSGARHWPGGDIVNKPWDELDKLEKFEATKAEIKLAEKDEKGGNYASKRLQALAQNGDASEVEDKDKDLAPGIKDFFGWWTNVREIGNIIKVTSQDSFAEPAQEKPKSVFEGDKVVPDPELGVTDEASLLALTQLEQEAYWRRHASGNSADRLERVVEACTAENSRDRITIPALLLEITKGLSEAREDHKNDAAPPLHWEEDGQRRLVAHTHDRIRKLVTSNLYSRRDIGLRLHSAIYAEMRGLLKGDDKPVNLPEPQTPIEADRGCVPFGVYGPEKFEFRPDDRQKWDEVVRRVFVNEEGEAAKEKVSWEFETREVSVDSSSDEEIVEEFSDHDIDCAYDTQVTGENMKLEKDTASPLGRDVSYSRE